MDDRVKKIKTSQQCEVFEKNAIDKGRPDLAKEAKIRAIHLAKEEKIRAIQLKAEAYGTNSDAEREAIEAVYAYEEALSLKNNKKTSATRTWPMIERHGILVAVERTVKRKTETQGYRYLLEMGLQDYAFEAVVVRYPELFSTDCVDTSKQRIAQWSNE